MLSVGADAYHRNMAVAKLFKALDILLASLRKLIKAAASRYIFIESFKCFIYRNTVGKLFKRRREIFYNSSVRLFILLPYGSL